MVYVTISLIQTSHIKYLTMPIIFRMESLCYQKIHRRKYMKKKFIIFTSVSSLLIVLLLIISLSRISHVPFSGQSISTKQPQTTAQTKQKDWKVTVIGNSLMRVGNQTKYLQEIGGLYGTKITINYHLIDGATLHQHLTDVMEDKNETRKALKTADIVIFQEYGTRYATTYEDISSMRKYMPSSARTYYYMTEFDNQIYQFTKNTPDDLIAKLKKSGVNIIKAEALIQSLLNMNYRYEQLHLPNDYHPNIANGYTCSILMYCQIFDKKCTDYPIRKCPENYRSFLKGDTWAKKQKSLRKILRKAERIRLPKKKS